MSYYRAALAAACKGDLTAAARLAECSVVIGEEAPSAPRLLELLLSKAAVDAGAEAKAGAMDKLRELTENRKYRKALRLHLPNTTKSYTIRGLLYAQSGRPSAARESFALALALDSGNDTALGALSALSAESEKPVKSVKSEKPVKSKNTELSAKSAKSAKPRISAITPVSVLSVISALSALSALSAFSKVSTERGA